MPEFDEYKDIYHNEINDAISFSGKPQDYFTKVKAEYLLELITRKVKREQALKVLDLGCGHGDVHDYLTDSGVSMELTGLDVAASVLEHAKKAHPGNNYITYEGNRIPFDDDTFDVAFTICVMHHVDPAQWASFLGEMRRVVRPSGIVVVFEHNPMNPVTRRIVNNCPLDENAVLLKSSNLTNLVQKTGLNQIETKFIIFTPFESRFFKGFDRAIGWLPLGAQYYVCGQK
ncbi:MAG: class I SAM-dependent methyltransferase [Pseudomonadota bacterium]